MARPGAITGSTTDVGGSRTERDARWPGRVVWGMCSRDPVSHSYSESFWPRVPIGARTAVAPAVRRNGPGGGGLMGGSLHTIWSRIVVKKRSFAGVLAAPGGAHRARSMPDDRVRPPVARKYSAVPGRTRMSRVRSPTTRKRSTGSRQPRLRGAVEAATVKGSDQGPQRIVSQRIGPSALWGSFLEIVASGLRDRDRVQLMSRSAGSARLGGPGARQSILRRGRAPGEAGRPIPHAGRRRPPPQPATDRPARAVPPAPSTSTLRTGR